VLPFDPNMDQKKQKKQCTIYYKPVKHVSVDAAWNLGCFKLNTLTNKFCPD